LIEAVKAQQLDDVQKMLPNVANLNEVYDIETALIAAAETGRLKAAKLPLAVGADPTKPSAQGYTALMTAKRQGFTELLKILEDHVASKK
jgi:ankyrin repeat protein